MEENQRSGVCPKCKGTGRIADQNGVHACWDCLNDGKLDVHSKKLPEHNIRL